jgi:CRP/FNR family transcriptional regulator
MDSCGQEQFEPLAQAILELTPRPMTLVEHPTCQICQLCSCVCEATVPTHLRGVELARRRIASGQTLYCQGDSLESVYAVRSGSFKSSLAVPNGREHIIGFHHRGELLGLDAVATGMHFSRVTALVDSEVCFVSYAQLAGLPAGNRQLMQALQREMARSRDLIALLRGTRAELRLASFLLSLSARQRAMGGSATTLELTMTRGEIASHLGLTLETVCRTLAVFQRRHWVRSEYHRLHLLDRESLVSARDRGGAR